MKLEVRDDGGYLSEIHSIMGENALPRSMVGGLVSDTRVVRANAGAEIRISCQRGGMRAGNGLPEVLIEPLPRSRQAAGTRSRQRLPGRRMTRGARARQVQVRDLDGVA